ncbi:MAG: hypothetical protein ACXWPM_07645 [Bdellovibrionota bacterium]
MKSPAWLAVIACCFLYSAPSHAWSLHYLITNLAFQNSAALKKSVQVEPILSFLKSEAPAISKVISQHYDWLESKRFKRFARMQLDTRNPTLESFLHALRLNPKSTLPMVRSVLPGERSSGRSVPHSRISSYEGGNDAFLFHYEEAASGALPASVILYTFSDEPDWQIDHELWGHPEYGYGSIPYGVAGTPTDRVAFHIQFLHEGLLLRSIAPEITEGMVFERIGLFSDLSRLGFHTGHPYWGYRFAAWAIHYLQDIAQPYHSRALPFESIGFYFRFLFSPDKAKFKETNSHILENRHISYEDMVATVLQDGQTQPTDVSKTLGQSISVEGTSQEIERSVRVEELFERTSRISFDQASETDHAVEEGFGFRITQDPNYVALNDSSFNIPKFTKSMAPAALQQLMDRTKKNLALTGQATRKLLELVLRPEISPLPDKLREANP